MSARHLVAVLPVLAAGAFAGCGASPDSAAVASARAEAPASGHAITVKATEFAFAPMALTAKAGSVKLTLVNAGTVEHELLVLKGAGDPAAMKVSGGRVSEHGAVGEVSETAPGATRSATLELAPGRYAIVCNVPGHYQGGMRGTLTVR